MAAVAVERTRSQDRQQHCLIDTAMAAFMLQVPPRKARHLLSAHGIVGCYGPHRRLQYRLDDVERLAEVTHAA